MFLVSFFSLVLKSSFVQRHLPVSLAYILIKTLCTDEWYCVLFALIIKIIFEYHCGSSKTRLNTSTLTGKDSVK